MATKTATTTSEAAGLAPAVLDKYKAAAALVDKALKAVVPLVKEGALVLDLCKAGDAAVESEAAKVYNKKGADKVAKGLAHPTTVSVNGVLLNFAPLPSDKEYAGLALKKDDLVKLTVGAHIDGYAAIAGESVVAPAAEEAAEAAVSDVRADLVQAAYQATEIALRAARPGAKNWELTAAIARVLDEYRDKTKVRGVELVQNQASFGWRIEKDDIQAKKTITPFPTPEQRRDSDNTHTLEIGEVYTLTIATTNGNEARARESSSKPTSIYCRLPATYQLKMKSSREVYSEIVKKAGAFPFPLRMLENESRAKLAVRECVQHGLVKPFDVYEAANPATDLTASFTVTFAVTKTGATRLTLPPTWYSAERVKSAVEIADQETKALLTKSLKPPKKKADKPKKEGEDDK